jgi:hypothetical protein
MTVLTRRNVGRRLARTPNASHISPTLTRFLLAFRYHFDGFGLVSLSAHVIRFTSGYESSTRAYAFIITRQGVFRKMMRARSTPA